MSAFLQTVQSNFQDYVLGASKEQPAIAALINNNFGLPADDRLAIYYDAYRIRLAEALSEAFGKTHAYVGDETFDALCRGYIDQYPSRYRNLRWFGDEFPAFVAQSLPEYPVVAELASFEWALGLAFDATDAPILSGDGLQQLGESDWERIGFTLSPSLQLLALHWNAPGIWLALEKEESPPDAVSSEEACTWVIWRKDLQAHFRSLDPYETLALRGLAQGHSFSSVCAQAAELSEHDITPQIAGWLHSWMTESVLSEINRAAKA
jgi:hypothetical protein